MEAIATEVNLDFKKYFLKEPKPFTSKREVNWKRVQLWAISLVMALVIGILVIPSSETPQDIFHEKADKGSLTQTKTNENDPTQETIRQLQESQVNLNQVHGSLNYLYRQDSPNKNFGGGKANQDKSSSMILSRTGTDSRTQLSAGTKFKIRLASKVTITNQPMPVVGFVSDDVMNENSTAIPNGSKILGDASFDAESERASINWRSIIMPDGRERSISAVAIGSDGQIGISGNVHSEGLKNALGQTLTRFVGAYATGSMNTGAFGANQGGHENGLKNAIAQTATDRANAMGEDLQKEHKWIELESGKDLFVILNQAFTFKDAGAMYGR